MDATKFVQRDELCDTTDTEHFRPGLEFNTCANRCGRAKLYGSFLKCACDEKCIIYRDCCDDMRTQCPQMFWRAKYTAGRLTQAGSTCAGLTLTVNKNIETVTTSSPYLYTSQTSAKIKPVSTFTTDALFTADVNLWSFLQNMSTFQVVDTQLGVVFQDYFSFNSWGISPLRMAIVPTLISLACVEADVGAFGERNLLRFLPFCAVTRTQTLATVFHRSCKSEGIIVCNCLGTSKVQGALRDACLHPEKLMRQLNKGRKIINAEGNELCELHMKGGRLDEIVEDSKLTVLSPSTKNMRRDQMAIPITVKPVETSRTSSKTRAFVDDGKPSKIRNNSLVGELLSQQSGDLRDLPKQSGDLRDLPKQSGDLRDIRQQSGDLSELPLEFVVDLEETLEKRLRCSTLDVPLSQCDLEECVLGALLVTNSLSPWAFNGNVCMFPGVAVVELMDTSAGVGVCNCLRITNALFGLKIWNVKIKDINQDQCVIQLDPLPYDPEAGLSRLYNFSADQLSRPPVAKFLGKLTAHTVKKTLTQAINKSRNACVEEMVGSFQLCFYSWTSEESHEKELASCISLTFTSTAQTGNKANRIEFFADGSKSYINILCHIVFVSTLFLI
ncbi:hypothetical protein ElyMa_003433200 [Elysia marginata]|uniref:SMB domain-containing protein n=1 Tax=Elysia marginata TaxID=1093978 RepID=A0AAV4JRU1_9GAST|nr:hypothetical protein ElyMa_003433200 [Elysia marginata]